MIKEEHHSFALQRLNDLGHTIYKDGKQILVYKGETSYDYKKIDTKIPVGECLLEEDRQTRKIWATEDLAKLGFGISSESIPKGSPIYYKCQGKIYYLERVKEGASLLRVPPGRFVEYSVINKKIRLVGAGTGPLGKGPWIDLKQKEKNVQDDYKDIISNYGAVDEKKNDSNLSEVVSISEIPIMISDNGELVCIPFERDEPTIGIVGVKRSGKSFFLHGLADRAYWKGGKNIAILNDALNECKSWALPWRYDTNMSEHGFTKLLSKINEPTLPLPAVFLCPTTSTLNEVPLEEVGVGHRMSFPFKELITNYNFYLKDRPEWKMTNAGRYFRTMMDELLKCKTMEEIEDVVYGSLPGKGDKGVRGKILSVMQDIFDRGFLDVNTGVTAKWDVMTKDGDERSYSPAVALMFCGLVPIIQTRDINTKDYFPQYFRYLVNDIFRKQMNDEFFILNNICSWLFVDEITGISSTQKPGPASEILQQCVAEGGPARIGFIYATQNYSKVNQRIRSNTKYLFSFRFNNKKEVNEIAGDFGLTKTQKEKILKLKKFELLAMTSERFVCYNSEGKRYYTDEPIKGVGLPSLSMHKSPKSKENEQEEDN